MTRVAVVGHIEWVDFIPVARMPRQGEVLNADGEAFSRAAGGGGVVAVVLAELGAEVDFFCALGDDTHGRAVEAQLRRRGVNVHAALRADKPTRRAITLLEDGGERTIVTVGERIQPLGSDDLPWDLLDEAGAAYFTAGDVAALEHARRAKALVASPRGRATLAQGPTIDALVYSGRDEDESAWARRLSSKAQLLIETRGAAGGSWRGESHGTWEAVPPEGLVRDSYGCGDSFAAGVTFGLAAGRPIADAVALGASCGARCLTRPGAP